jgi:predicted ATPase/DNA-binding CsgD family transcriptional regulator/transcriptional regulator with XRE-family HTH domain
MMDGAASFGSSVKKRRQALKLRQSALAQQVGCSTITIRKIEADERRPSMAIAERIADCFALQGDERAAFLKSARPVSAPIPAVRVPEPPRTNLVLPPTPLIGRQYEVESIRAYLGDSSKRLLTLTGPGGIGKTRLALEVAGLEREAYADGVWLVELAAVNDVALVAPAIAQTFRLHEEGGHSAVEQLQQALRDKHMLLVLDNFEQVVDAAPLVGELLSVAPRLSILVTSRSPLHLRGEQVVDVPPLAIPPPREACTDDPAEIADFVGQYPAVQCFVTRAQAVRAGFALSSANARAVAELCIRLDGLPLAIELAAARIALLSPGAMIERLDQTGGLRLRLLTGGARDLPARQRTLRATIEWSHSLLEPGEQRLFARLSVFVGGCTMEAAEAICHAEDGDLIDELQSLLNKSLLRTVTHSTAIQFSEEARITMFETIREFAREQLESRSEAETLRYRHAAYYLALAERAGSELSGPTQRAWLERLEQEHDNLRAALQWGLICSHSDALDIALRLACALTDFWKMRGYYDEGRGWWERLLAASGNRGDVVRARALSNAGTMAWTQCDFARATELHAAALELSRRLDDQHGIATALHNLGAQATEQGDSARALPLLEESLRLRRELNDIPGMAATLSNLGVIADYHSEYDTAAALYLEGLELARTVGDQWLSALILTNLGEVVQHQDNYERATALYEEAFVVAQALDSRPLCAVLLLRLGNLATLQQMPWRAVNRLQEALALLRLLGNTVGVITCLEGLAAALAASPRPVPELARGAVRLWAAIEKERVVLHSPRPLIDALLYTPYIEAACLSLGEAVTAEETEAGWAMSFEQAVAYAQQITLNPPEPAPNTRAERTPASSMIAPPSANQVSNGPLAELSPRELDVLRLVAEGLPDKEVAERLVISPRTVNAHLTSIYSKLGVNSRRAIMLLAIDHLVTTPSPLATIK